MLRCQFRQRRRQLHQRGDLENELAWKGFMTVGVFFLASAVPLPGVAFMALPLICLLIMRNWYSGRDG